MWLELENLAKMDGEKVFLTDKGVEATVLVLGEEVDVINVDFLLTDGVVEHYNFQKCIKLEG